MALGKYLTNTGVIGAVIAAFGTAKQTQQMPKDWRRIVIWAVWAAGLVLALGGAAKQVDDENFEHARKAAEHEAKITAKQQSKLKRAEKR